MILRIFHDTDLRNSHHGLSAIALEEKISVDKLKNGEHLLFFNAAKTKVKIYSSHGLLSYYVAPSGKLNLNIIQELPSAFNAGAFDFKKAERKALEKMLARRGITDDSAPPKGKKNEPRHQALYS